MEKVGNDDYQLERFSKTKEEFDHYYDNELKQKVDALEKERQKTMNLAKKTAMKLILPIVAVIILYFIYSGILILAIPLFIIYGGYLFTDVRSKRKALADRIKREVVTDLVSFMNENFTYKPNKFLSSTKFKVANIFKHKPNRYTGDDLITGYVASDPEDVKGIEEKPPRTDISFSEVKADYVEHYRDKNRRKRERVHTIFKGLFFKADFNKNFDGLTLVVPKEKSSKGFSIFGKEKDNKLEEVELEDIDFMEKFTVRTTDQILARYILTPGFMNRLLDFSNRDAEEDPRESINQPTSVKEAIQLGLSAAQNESESYSDTPYFSFRNGSMYFMLPTQRNHFDFSILTPLNKRLIYSYFKDINIALEMVDELNLNLRIWTKD